jgi:ribose/xylose/arabinose/galactoside ABC-type transport system permease subunit
MHPFIVTLGTMSIFRGICNVAVPLKTLPSPGHTLPESYTMNFLMYQPYPGLLPVPMLIMLLCVVAGWFHLHLTVSGREYYAIGGNEEASRFSGLRVDWIKLRVYALCGLAAGIAGMVYAGYYGSASSNTGLGWELMVIAASVVGGASLSGGRGTAIGALLGTLVIKLIENGIYIMKYDQQYSTIIVGAAIIIAVAIDRFSEYVSQKRSTGTR